MTTSDAPNISSDPEEPDHSARPLTSQPGASRQKPGPGLHIVATPIGNASDITLRALDVLRDVELIACEDTRVTGKLLARHGIETPTTAYHDHNAAKVRPGLLAKLAAGVRIALVSDAGTPLINDPGYRLVRDVVDAGIPVTALPGPSSIMAALCLAGLPTDRFFFAGFLPPKSGQRRNELKTLAAIPATRSRTGTTNSRPITAAVCSSVRSSSGRLSTRALTMACTLSGISFMSGARNR